MAATIYLHWSATPYTWVRSGLYHTIVAGDGHLHRLHSYTIDLNAHTWRRNSNAVAISCACMRGRPDPWTMPPTEAQIEAMCREVAGLAAVALGAAVLAHHSAGQAFRGPVTLLQDQDSPAPAFRAQKFPSARSLSIAFSSSASARSFLSRAFSFST
jgi:hypothetical protein